MVIRAFEREDAIARTIARMVIKSQIENTTTYERELRCRTT